MLKRKWLVMLDDHSLVIPSEVEESLLFLTECANSYD